jgi:ATP-binding cassette subfamily B protein
MLLRYLPKKSWAYVVLCLFSILGQVYLDLQIPLYMEYITDALQRGASVGVVLDYGWKMVMCAFASLGLTITTGFLASIVGASLGKRLRVMLFDKIREFTPQDTDHFSSSSLITRSTNDVVQVQSFTSLALSILIRAPIMATLAFFRISGGTWQWTFATAMGFAVMTASIGYILWVTRPYYKAIPPLTDDINRHTQEHITGIRVVRAYNAERFQERLFGKTSEDLRENDLFIWRRTSLLPPISSGISNFLTLAIYWIGTIVIVATVGVTEKQELFSQMIVFSSYGIQVLLAFMLMVHVVQASPRAMVSSKRVQEVIEYDTAIPDGEYEGPGESEGEVEFRDVSFTYPGTKAPVLDGVSFKVRKGETLAIIGSTGSGKTTLVNLIPRFYLPTSGQVLVDGVDVKEYRRRNLNSKFGYVPQANVTFSGTVASNVRFGDMSDTATDEDVAEAIRIAQAMEFVESKEGGMDHEVTENGNNLSGGQRQRLSIARAVCRKPEIFILDDSFSALDFKTDRALREELRRSVPDSTFIIVAQRVGTIMNADQILVLDEGRVVGRGRHEELMESCELYREIAVSQMAEGAE